MSAVMRPAQLAQTAVAAFEEVMEAQNRPKAKIRFIADAACEKAAEILADAPEAPARIAFDVAFHEVSRLVRGLLVDTGHLPEAVHAIRDEAHKRARQIDADGPDDAEPSPFVQTARKLFPPDG